MEYKYIKYDLYHIYKIVNEKGHCTEVCFHQKLQKDILDNLERDCKAIVKRYKVLAIVLFETEEDTIKAIEYLQSYEIMKKLTKK